MRRDKDDSAGPANFVKAALPACLRSRVPRPQEAAPKPPPANSLRPSAAIAWRPTRIAIKPSSQVGCVHGCADTSWSADLVKTVISAKQEYGRRGEFVAIDIDSGAYEIDPGTAAQAGLKARLLR